MGRVWAAPGIAMGMALLAGCSNTGTDRVTVIVGATLLGGMTEAPDSVVVIDGKRVRSAGPRPTTPIPQDSNRIDGTGQYVRADDPAKEIAAGEPADLVLLDKDRKVERRMVDGQWVKL